MRDNDLPPLPGKPPPADRPDDLPSGDLVRLDAPETPAPRPTTTQPADIHLEPHDYQEHQPPTFAERMFAIGWMGWVRLAALSVVVGVLIRAAGVNPFDRTFTFAGALGDMAEALVSLGGWVIANGWLPLLTGALVVVPLWLLWRLLSLPFRRGRDHRNL